MFISLHTWWLARAGNVILLMAFPLKLRYVFVSLIIYDVISKIDAKNHNEKLTFSQCS